MTTNEERKPLPWDKSLLNHIKYTCEESFPQYTNKAGLLSTCMYICTSPCALITSSRACVWLSGVTIDSVDATINLLQSHFWRSDWLTPSNHAAIIR